MGSSRSVRILDRLRELCLALPQARETSTWGSPHFRVRDKIFAGFDPDAPTPVLGFKLSLERQAQMLRDPRFRVAPYVGRYGWVSMDLSGVSDWDEVRAFLVESYCAIAPKSLAAQLEGGQAAALRRKTKTSSRKPSSTRRRDAPDPRRDARD